MHIKAICPECESTYQVDPTLKGKRMRCPNPMCRTIFEVKDAAEPAPPAVAAPVPPAPAVVSARLGQSGAVGQMVPVLPAEPAPVDDFLSDSSSVSQTEPAVFTNGPTFADWQDAPPIREMLQESTNTVQFNGTPATAPSVAHDLTGELPAPSRGHWPLVALVAMLLIGAGAAVFWVVNLQGPSDESDRFAKAEKEYNDRNFGDAAEQFGALWTKWPVSPERPTYHFLHQLSQIRDGIHRTQTDVEDTVSNLDRLKKFLDYYQGDPLIDKHRDDLSESLYRLVEDLTGFAAKDGDRTLLETAKRLNTDTAKRFKLAPLEQARNINAAFETAEQSVAKAETRARALAQLTLFDAQPSLESVEQGAQLAQQAGIADEPGVKAILERLPEQHRKSIKYLPELAAISTPSFVSDNPPSIAVLHNRNQRPFFVLNPGSQPVFALVRGVLYAMDPATGSLAWARRVGVDTSGMPLWLPPTEVTPPTVLVASSEAGGLLALHGDNGSTLWRQPLPEPCTGQPLQVGNRVFVACRGGAVYEIDIITGNRLGGYQLGLELTHGGILQPGTNLVYFAADRGCVVALDVAQRQCAAILYTGHPSGSLRCPPVVLPLSRGEVVDPSSAGPPQGLLLLCQDDGRQGTDLLSYALPVANPRASPTKLGDKLPGRVWYPPLCNSESFNLVTDAGAFAIFGLRQRDNRDADVFPMFHETLDTPTASGSVSRPLALFADGQNFWALAQGRLHCFQVSMSPTLGWRITSRAVPISTLGSALHGCQVHVDGQGQRGLFLVTDTPGGKACLMTAVDLDQPGIRWQRQIGFVPQGPPSALAGKILAWDRGGDLLLFDSEKSVKQPGFPWQRDGKLLVRDSAGLAWLLPHSDGKTLFALAAHGFQAKAWKYHDGIFSAVGPPLVLDAPAAGTPALLGETMILPLANGRLARFGAGPIVTDDEWRAPLADKNASGHAVAIGADKLVCTNGSQGLTLWRFDGMGLARIKTAEVKGRIIAPPALLPGHGPDAEFRLCIAEVGRSVALLQGENLRKVREWTISDAITAGPFVRGSHIGLVVGGRRLVWLDPDSDQPLWAHTFRADIVGEPVAIDGNLIVADESGQIQALDPGSGRLVGLGYALRAAVAPASTPLPYGADRLFVPLTDGTVLLPSRLWFRSTILGLPIPR